MKKFTVLLSVVLAFGGISAQTVRDDGHTLLSWNPFYTLQWYDFKGKPPKGSRGDAGTAVKIKAKPFRVGNEIQYDVTATFDRQKSWARDTSASLLRHERLHFDIAEVYARKIRKKVSDLRSESVHDLSTYTQAIEDLMAESDETDRRYDIETLHGALLKKQDAWSLKVKAELASLDEYKKSKRIIGNSGG
jgi:hypothetical protein